MMLIPGFYTIRKVETDEDSLTADILLNPNHKVYQGHFPGQPVVPGVIQLQIVKEVLEKSLGVELFMNKVNSVKYLRIITPGDSPKLKITIAFRRTGDSGYNVNAQITSGKDVFTKVKTGMRIV
ncbi:MAG: hydroxymyristoyl-ACP dehydratase [Bacteroidales bacterium]|nr:hydroxymyristoyl-ACP dehydratase [Bacteroidales bacterium]MCF6341913.1 hydroxymyristoyl-ACP dehydratase [Bacteroidales bacterium]